MHEEADDAGLGHRLAQHLLELHVGIKAAGSRDKLLTDSAVELLFRVCRGIPRIASRLLRAALKEAHARNQNVVDDSALKAAVETLTLVEEVKP